MSISEQIKALMKANNVSRYKLSKDTGIPYTTLTQIINGRTKNPQVSALEAIADYFKKPLDFLLGKSLGAVVERRLVELDMTWEQLAEKSRIPLFRLQNLDNLSSGPRDYEQDRIIDRLAKALDMDPKELASAYARQESPACDDPQKTAEEERKDERLINDSKTPYWATRKDVRDFKKMLEEDVPVMFDGVPLDEEDKEKVLKVMEAIFWDAKKRNKRKRIEE